MLTDPHLPIAPIHGDTSFMTNHPKRTATYHGPITDSTRWDGFDLRAGDVFICTPPKCGTTWSQNIICMMLQGKVAFEGSLGKISPWLESQSHPIDVVNENLSTQTHRRCIKSHSPFDGITYNPQATYIAVYRHPLDVHFSMRKHVENMNGDELDHLFPDDPRQGALMFINDTAPAGDCDHLTLDTMTQHYKSFKKWQDLPNVHLFHYADMRADLPRAMAGVAAALGCDFDDTMMTALVKGAGFDEMRKNADRFTPSAGTGTFKDDVKFFSSATAGKWLKRLTDADMEKYAMRMDQLLGADDRHWLEHGSV
jgi:aryl sulfotransferase